MKLLKKNILLFLLAITLFSCNNPSAVNVEDNIPQNDSTVIVIKKVEGSFVSDGYEKRAEGFDWVAVTVLKTSDSTLNISVRSRADKKKPTCTFDAKVNKINDHTYKTVIEGKSINFTFSDSTLDIAGETEEDRNLLYYYCSGGGSLAGTYKKLNEPLDEEQIDKSVFKKMLSLQNLFFEITTTGKGSIQQLTIQPVGLKIDNKKISREIEGMVTNAEIEDLNSDGFPEVLIYTVSAGSGSYGNVIGYSVNNGKSVSQIYFPAITDDPKASKGYMGHDEFAIVENSLVRRFQIYNDGDANSKPTGNIRQVQYKLKDGEASRKFEVVNITEYPAK